jgi:hypothetical protein
MSASAQLCQFAAAQQDARNGGEADWRMAVGSARRDPDQSKAAYFVVTLGTVLAPRLIGEANASN